MFSRRVSGNPVGEIPAARYRSAYVYSAEFNEVAFEEEGGGNQPCQVLAGSSLAVGLCEAEVCGASHVL